VDELQAAVKSTLAIRPLQPTLIGYAK